MNDWDVSATVVASSALWVIGCGLMVVGAFDLRFMGWGLWSSGVAAVLTVRRMLMCHQDTRNAFELGRDYERSSSSSVRAIR